jgi:PAS domain S-box-containing protein/putative nucleotidyltransferase with HDIG domain
MKKKPAVTLGATEGQPNPLRLLRLALIVGVYLIAFTILDFITKQFEGLPGVVTWYPPAGLTYALLLVFGVTFTPAVTVTLFISSLITYRMPQAPYLLLLWAFVISLIYGLGAAFLRKRIRFDWQLRKLRDVAWFVCTTVLVSALLAVLSVSSSALSSAMPRSAVLRAIFDWWIGETVGVLTVTPFLLIFVMPALKRFAEGQPVSLPARRSFPHPTLSTFGQAASIVLVLYLVFGTSALADYHPMFLISLPLIWIALQRGFKGISVALLALNSGVVLALWLFRFDPAQLGELELLMIVNCIVGLLMGAVVTERKQAEETLQQSEAKFRSIFDNAAEGIFQSTPEGKFLMANPAMAHILGFSSPEQLIRERTDIARQSYVDPAQREEFKRLMEQQNKISGFEYTIPRKDGSVAWVSETTQAVRDATGRIVYYEGIFIDITERRRTESERQSLLEIMQGVASTESLDELLKLIRQSLAKVIYAENFFVVFKNKDTGLFEEVYAVDKYDPAMPPSKLEKSMVSYVFRTGESLLLTQAKFEELVRRGEAELIGTQPAIWMGAPLKTPHETIGVIAVQNYETPDCYSERDKDFLTSVSAQVAQVIERKQAEEALRESEERYRSLYENATIGIYRTTPDGRILVANPALVRMLGYPSFEELAQRDLSTEGYEPEYLRQDFQKRVESEGKISGLESAWKRKDGSTVYVHESSHLVRDDTGQPLYYEGTVEDITERKRADGELVIANKELLFQNEEKEKRATELILANKELLFQNEEKEKRAAELSIIQMETGRRLQHIEALHIIDQAISGSIDLRLTLSIVFEQIASQLNVDAVDVLLLNPHSQTLEYAAGRGFRSKVIERSHLRLSEGLAGRVALEQRTVVVHDLLKEKKNFVRDELLTDEDFECYYGVPLVTKGQLKGVLEVFLRSHHTVDDEWLNFLETLAGQVAIAVDSASLFDSLQRSNTELFMAYDATIEGWSAALDLRDKETEGHTQRVTEMTVKLARSLGLGEAELAQMRWGALLHDIGKMGIPDGILLKPGPLTDEEWVVMKEHPTFAYKMISPIHYLKAALDIPYCHHEKWDGTGYPRGLKGEQIPLAARIFAVVDVWDALISDRPYRKAWSEEKTRQHIQAGAGTHFDPQVVKTFFLEHE